VLGSATAEGKQAGGVEGGKTQQGQDIFLALPYGVRG
jgi:hypothetical protein